MCKSGVYQIILREDGRSYIGSAVDILARWQAHKNNALNEKLKVKQVVSRALRKHGLENFDWKVLEYCSKETLIEREQHYLDTIRPFADEGNGFNVRKIAKSNKGIIRSVEAREKQSKTMLGVPKTEEHKRNMSLNWHKNRGEEYYQQLSEKVSGDKNPAKRKEVREKISKANTGRTWKNDVERVKRHSAQRKGKTYSDEAKANMKLAQQKNKTRTPEAKEKFYLAQRKLYEITSPEGEVFQIYSRELKQFCKEKGFQYTNLIGTATTGKPYKKGWLAKRL